MLNIRDLGAGNGNAAQDTQAFRDAAAIFASAGGGGLYVPAGRYSWLEGVNFHGSVRILGDGPSSVIVGTGGNASNSGRQLDISSDLGAPLTATGALEPGPLSLTLNATTGLTAGSTVYLYLGSDPLDSAQPWIGIWNRVASITGNVVTFYDPCPESIADPAILGHTHKVFPVPHPAEGIEVGHLAFERDIPSGNRGYNVLSCQYARNVWFHDLHFKDSGFACAMAIHSANVEMERIWADRSIYDGAFSTASGGMLAGWYVRNLSLRQIVGRDIGGIAVSFEGQNRGITLDGFDLSANQESVAFPTMLSFPTGSRGVVVKNGRLSSAGSRTALAGAWERSENLALDGNSLNMRLDRHDGGLFYNGARAGAPCHWTHDFAITPGMQGQAPFTLPAGWYRSVRAFVSSLEGITNAALMQEGAGGSGPFLSHLTAGQMVDIPIYSTINPSGQGFNYNPANGFRKTCVFTTDGTVPTGATARLEIDYWPVAA